VTKKPFAALPFRFPRIFHLLLALAVLLELIIPFTTKTYGVDGHLQVNMIDQFTHLVSEGVLIPCWVPDGFHGFGATTFYFYPPVMLYLATFFKILIGQADPFTLYQMSGLAATIGSFFSARILLKSIGSEKYQINMGALLYAFAPFRLADLYGRSNLATHVAYVFIPLVWYGLIEIVRKNDSRRVERIVPLGISCALLALTNIPAVLATAVCIAIAALVVRKYLTMQATIDASIAALIGVGLCAYHFFSAISLGPYSHLSDLDGGDPQFILLHLFIQTSIPALYYIILLYAAIAIIAFAYWRSRKSRDNKMNNTERIVVQVGFAIVALTIYLETPYVSLPAWRYLPIFKLIQFGWRFYSHFVLFVAVLVGVAYSNPMRRAAKSALWVWILGALCPATLLVLSLHIFPHTSRPLEDPLEYRPVYSAPSDDFVNQLPGKKVNFIPVIEEMTRVYQPHRMDPPAVAEFEDGEKIARVIAKPYFEEYDVNLHGRRKVTFHRFWWPTWHLYINNHEIISQPDSIGRAATMLPEGDYTIKWQLEKTPLELAGLWISEMTLCGIALAYMVVFFQRYRRGRIRKDISTNI
jgi:hypothetical protein